MATTAIRYCAFSASDGQRCPAESLPDKNLCAVHEKYKINTAKVKCNRCKKGIRVGDWTTNDPAGNVIHSKPCHPPEPKAEAAK